MDSIDKEFLEQTKTKNLEISAHKKGLPQPPLEEAIGLQAAVPLPSPETLDLGRSMDVRSAIEHRSSIREYSDQPLTLEELTYLLWCTQGIKKILPDKTTFRNVPSAGSSHAFETYLLVNRVTGLEPGLYRYLALSHSLALSDNSPAIADQIIQAGTYNQFIKTSAVTFLWVAVPYRLTWKFQTRGLRYLFLDAGHVCQNLYLAAESIQCGVCAVNAFDDDLIDQALNLSSDQFVIYLAPLGKKIQS
ncbi:MAG: SagB/ThcOx family dehydrogenase [Peptococcaceae bacterium]|jgi:SagB-type dehydrogenase family enzyme|nr:SagB/ThcOx family dehydrogenase [Peptococcaceae bacterium]